MNGVSKHLFNKPKKVINYKNIEFRIAKDKRTIFNFDKFSISNKYENVYTIPDDNKHYLFNCSGVIPISKGQTITLTPSTVIKCYLFGYFNTCIFPKPQNKFNDEQLLNDILTHYKRTEIFKEDYFDSYNLSETALKYIKNCKATGLINSAVKICIKEKQL